MDYIQKDGNISRVTARQYPDLNEPAMVGEAVMFQQFPSMKEANLAQDIALDVALLAGLFPREHLSLQDDAQAAGDVAALPRFERQHLHHVDHAVDLRAGQRAEQGAALYRRPNRRALRGALVRPS